MRTAAIIIAAVSSLALATPGLAQQVAGSRSGPSAPRMGQGGWKPSTPRPGGWQPARPGKPGGWQPGKPGGWQPGKPGGWQHGKPGGWQPGKPGGWQPGKPGGWHPGKPGGWQPGKPGAHKPGWRWGDKYKGRWKGGWHAPGGWGGYKRPVRGWTLPSYWFSSSFFLSDWQNWGLSSPAHGYNWVRYYDDAVLVDQYGRVWDSVSGIDWDRGDGYPDGHADGEYAGDGGYGAEYDAPDYADAPPPPPPVVYAQPAPGLRCVANCYPVPAYGYAPSTTTTVVIQSAPMVTTTTTVTEEYVTYGGRKVVRAPSKRLYRAPAKVRTKTCHCR